MAYLYGVEAAGFVAARTALVKSIRAGGDKELAASVKSLRKPSLIAAELNRSLRASVDELRLLLEAASELRNGHRAVLSGRPVDLAALQRAHRHAAAAVAAHASRDRDRVAAILEAASLDEAYDATLRAGTFAVEPSPASGFDLFASSTVEPVSATVTSLDRARRRRARAAKKADGRAADRNTDDTGTDDTGTDEQTSSTAVESSSTDDAPPTDDEDVPTVAGADPAAIRQAENAVRLARRRAAAAADKRTRAIERIAELERRLDDARANLSATERAAEAASAALAEAEGELADTITDGPSS